MNTLRLQFASSLLLASVGVGLAQAPLITSFSQNGQLVCSNLAAGSVASVEWAPSLNGPWQTDWAGLDAVTVATNGTITVSVPMFYRVRGFSGPSAPTPMTSAATAVTSSSATLNGAGTPNGAAATAYFRYSTTDPGTGNDTFGTRVPASFGSDTALGSGWSSVAYSQPITGLAPGTTYYYCAIVVNAYGTSFGPILSFTTSATAPATMTSTATSLTGTTATLNGSANPEGAATTGWFRYSTTNPGTGNDTAGTRVPSTGGTALGSGTSPVAYSQGISGLTPGTTYYFWAISQNSVGTSYGSILTFTTPLPPTATTTAATSVANTSATLNGSGNPGGAATTGWFRYSTTSPGTGNDVAGTRVPITGGTSLGSGTSAVAYSQTISGLTPSTTYCFWAIDQNSEGTAFGSVLSFTTPNAPTANTTAATSVTSSGATLNGAGISNLASATGYFRYSTTDPGTGNDSFGTRAPTTGGSSLGSGSTAVAYSQAITGLLPGTTYYYCAIVANAYGTSFGPILSFTTSVALPTTTTSSATSLTGTTATLNGSANPGGASTTGWFRYSTTNPGTPNDTAGTRAPTTGGSSLGSGTSAVAYSQNLTGLTPGTTYYFWAISQNSVGTSYGSILTFIAPLPPTVATSAASAVNNTSATLNGSGNPGGASTTGWFRYSTTNPGTANDTAGTRAPTTGGSSLGSGTSAVAYSQTINSLTPGTTYYFWAIDQNSEGIAFGSVLSFTTANAPTANTTAATSVTSSTATLNGTGIPNLASAYGFFRYSTTDPGTGNDSFGTRVPSSSSYDTALGSGSTAVAYSQAITGLLPGTTYYYCAIVRNTYGNSFGPILSFTTSAALPTTTTSSATSLTGTTATLNGSANPDGASTTGWFRYSTTSPGTGNDVAGTRAPTTGGSALGSGTSAVAYSQAITGLTPGTTYYFWAISQNSVGTSYGSILTFTTPLPPTVTTSAASSVASTSATLNGSGNPGGASTTGWFRYSTTNPGTGNDVAGTRAPTTGGSSLGSGTSAVAYSQTISGLTAGTTYYFWAIDQSSEGIAFGSVLSFTTANAPTANTTAATSVTSSTATLNGTGNPNLASATGYFRYSTTDPGTGNDTFGTRAPTTGGLSLGSGSTPVAYSQAITGLLPGTTYYYCAIAVNAYGTSFGPILSFTTTAALPTTTTSSATSLTGTTATLNGSANPGGASTTGWFRYSTTSPGTGNDVAGTRAPTTGGTSLGSGTSAVAYSQAITGLTPGTTYYFWAISQNSVGTSYGSVLTFTTPLPPTATTTAATSIVNTSATLNGSGNPDGTSTTGWFRYSTTSPGTGDDVTGTRAPTTGGTSLGSGTSAVAYSQTISGLTPGTTYYFWAIDQSSEGTAFGSVLSFTTANAPTANTTAATSLTSSGATLNGTGNPNLASATGYFRYSTTDPGTGNDSFGTRVPTTGGSSLGSGSTPVAYSQAITGLLPGTTYYYCAIVANAYGTSFGPILSFTTSAALPTTTTSSATSLTGTTATLNGSANPGGASTTGWFRYSTTSPGTGNDVAGTRAPSSGGSSLGSGTSAVAYSQNLTGLTPGTTYYFWAISQNSVGTSYGSILAFTTPLPPTVTTSAASSVAGTSATLNGTATPNRAASTGWFRYSTVNPGTGNDTAGTRAPTTGGTSLGSGTSAVAYSQFISGLTPGTIYYFWAIASNSEGTSFGSVLSFTTANAPTVNTTAATSVTSSGATLNGTGNPNLASTTGWFRYSTTNPGTGNDSFGTRVPTTGGTSLGSGSTAVSYSQAITGLLPGTTYYYCAIAANAYGTSVGPILSFTTSPALPTTTTTSATSLTGTAATLNGNANPGGASTTGWFRYSTTSPGTGNDVAGTRAPTAGGSSLGLGTSAVAYSQDITGLTPGTTYYFWAISQNSVGTSYGSVLSFTTPLPPTVTTSAASSVADTSATLNGTATPNRAASTGWFRYSTVDPGTGDDTAGTRAPTTGGSALGSGTSGVAYSLGITDLTPGTTYYFWAIASNSEGTSFGSVLSFTTP